LIVHQTNRHVNTVPGTRRGVRSNCNAAFRGNNQHAQPEGQQIPINTMLNPIEGEDPTAGPTSGLLCSRLKAHLLIHLKECAIRLAAAVHYNTEPNELSLGRVRDMIFHTNRLNPSRGLAIKFGRKEMLQHIILGGCWNNGENRAGNLVCGVVCERAFEGLFLVAGRHYDYNRYESKKQIVKNTTGVFDIGAGPNRAPRIFLQRQNDKTMVFSAKLSTSPTTSVVLIVGQTMKLRPSFSSLR
jgi:hypothetical protein